MDERPRFDGDPAFRERTEEQRPGRHPAAGRERTEELEGVIDRYDIEGPLRDRRVTRLRIAGEPTRRGLLA